jgi:hypothetical protein
MREEWAKIPEKKVQLFDKEAITLSFETISGTDVLRLKRCDGREHWFEEQKATEIADGVLDISLDHPGGKTECDCPDKENRKDAFDLFK